MWEVDVWEKETGATSRESYTIFFFCAQSMQGDLQVEQAPADPRDGERSPSGNEGEGREENNGKPDRGIRDSFSPREPLQKTNRRKIIIGITSAYVLGSNCSRTPLLPKSFLFFSPSSSYRDLNSDSTSARSGAPEQTIVI